MILTNINIDHTLIQPERSLIQVRPVLHLHYFVSLFIEVLDLLVVATADVVGVADGEIELVRGQVMLSVEYQGEVVVVKGRRRRVLRLALIGVGEVVG